MIFKSFLLFSEISYMIGATNKTTANETKVTQLKGIERSRTKENVEEKTVKYFLKNLTSG